MTDLWETLSRTTLYNYRDEKIPIHIILVTIQDPWPPAVALPVRCGPWGNRRLTHGPHRKNFYEAPQARAKSSRRDFEKPCHRRQKLAFGRSMQYAFKQ